MEKEKFLAREIEKAREVVKKAHSHLNGLISLCNHKIEQDMSSAYCDICGKDFGWWCPESSDHYCKYDDDGSEGCICCGEPYERK